jgi:hypothetical protein
MVFVVDQAFDIGDGLDQLRTLCRSKTQPRL